MLTDRAPNISSDELTTPARAPVRGGSQPRVGHREGALFFLAIGVIALHVVDDNYLQPQPGTSAGCAARLRWCSACSASPSDSRPCTTRTPLVPPVMTSRVC